MNKAQEYANILLRGQRLGMLNAQEAANMMIRATEGNERALRFLLEQFGIAAPEFVSMQTLFEELARHVSEGTPSRRAKTRAICFAPQHRWAKKYSPPFEPASPGCGTSPKGRAFNLCNELQETMRKGASVMAGLRLKHDCWVLVADGERALFLRDRKSVV